MTTTKNTAKRILSIATTLIATLFLALVLPARTSYASVDPWRSEEMSDADFVRFLLEQEIEQESYRRKQAEQDALLAGTSGIGRAEGVIVEEALEPNEVLLEPSVSMDTTSEIQLVFALIAAVFPLAHFAKKVFRPARRKKSAQVVRIPYGPNVAQANTMRVPQPKSVSPAVAQTAPRPNACGQRKQQPVMTQTQQTVAFQPQQAMVFQRQPLQQTRRYPIQQPARDRRGPVQQVSLRRGAPVLVYA